MKISTIETGYFKLDGGAMFGIVPKKLWEKKNPADSNNLCTWSMRCLLIETEGRKILIDTGLGDKQDDRFRSHFEPHGEDNLLKSLQLEGVQAEEITDVFLTHLHFDHSGGAVRKNNKGVLVPTFPNASYWTNEVHYKWALQPNQKEAGSFLPENYVPLEKAGVLKHIDVQRDPLEWMPGIEVHFLYGHTEAMMMLKISPDNHAPVYYCADLIPSAHHIHLPWIMSYDVRPLVTLAEKESLLPQMLSEGAELYFEHDPVTVKAKLKKDQKGRITV